MSRIQSILKSKNLDFLIPGIADFKLSQLDLPNVIPHEIPTNLRLGHLAEKVVSILIKTSRNYNVLHENVQIIDNKKTIGELDFIVKELQTNKITHIELAYKFYLYDPIISKVEIHNWIGPNRNDTLKQKVEKLTSRQFPLLYDDRTAATLDSLEIDQISQSNCFLASLYLPYQHETDISPMYRKAIVGYYLDLETFKSIADYTKTKSYYVPIKTEWGMDPSEHKAWLSYSEVIFKISDSLGQKQSVLCWCKAVDHYESFFVVWW